MTGNWLARFGVNLTQFKQANILMYELNAVAAQHIQSINKYTNYNLSRKLQCIESIKLAYFSNQENKTLPLTASYPIQCWEKSHQCSGKVMS